MIIKKRDSQNLISRKINLFGKRRSRLRMVAVLVLGFLLVSALVLGSISYGIVLNKMSGVDDFKDFLKMVSQSKLRMIPNYFKGLITTPDRIIIDVKQEDFQKLVHKREEALSSGFLVSQPDDYVPGRIRYKNKTVRVDLRLKGDEAALHLKDDKWSFRIKVKGDDALFGMKKFSIQHPRTRNYIYEWLFHKVFGREGGMALRYNFIDVTLNGKHLGIYALEEHFDTQLIEHNARRPGPIIKFDESLWWEEERRFSQSSKWLFNRIPGYGSYYSLAIDAFKLNKLKADPRLFEEFKIAANLLERFRLKQLSTREVFDIDKLAKFFALCDLFGNSHPLHTNQFRFYYNPITSLLEPISFDICSDSGRIEHLSCIYAKETWFNRQDQCKILPMENFFSDQVFFKEYVKTLERISKPAYLDRLFAELSGRLKENLSILYKEWPFYFFSKDILYQNQKDIREVLNPPKGLHAYFRNFSNHCIELELGNIQVMPIEILGIYYNGFLIRLAKEVILSGKDIDSPVEYQSVKFQLPPDYRWEDTKVADLKVSYRVFGTSNNRLIGIYPWPQHDENFIVGDFIRQKANCQNFDFIKTDESSKKIYIQPGNWNLDEDLIIPVGYRVICSGGTRLNLLDSAKILSYSPLEFSGSQSNPVIIYSRDSTGQGIGVIGAGGKTTFRYVIFDNLTNLSQEGWELSGAVTFYESPVEIYNCQFSNSRAEDMLNIIRSDFLIDKCFFGNAFSDGFDADFSQGKIVDSFFADCGDDAIDVSGSIVKLAAVAIDGVGDKGLSIGENSKMTANEIDIKNTKIAAVSKDISELKVSNLNMYNCKVGLVVYQKKPEFGPAMAKIADLIIDKVDIPYWVEEGSELSISGEKIKSNQKDVEEKVKKYLGI